VKRGDGQRTGSTQYEQKNDAISDMHRRQKLNDEMFSGFEHLLLVQFLEAHRYGSSMFRAPHVLYLAWILRKGKRITP
jgi:hypothetical protein